MIGLVDVPTMDLPVKVTVIRHPKEKRSKSSVIPSQILAPKDVEIIHSIEVPEHLTAEKTVLMFPSDDATEITEMTKEELADIKRVVLIDSTWSQTKYYLRQPILEKMRHVKIQTEKTMFWRYQKGEADTSLATIEALYFFFRDYETRMKYKNYHEYYSAGGKFDNLLYFYVHNFKVI